MKGLLGEGSFTGRSLCHPVTALGARAQEHIVEIESARAAFDGTD